MKTSVIGTFFTSCFIVSIATTIGCSSYKPSEAYTNYVKEALKPGRVKTKYDKFKGSSAESVL